MKQTIQCKQKPKEKESTTNEICVIREYQGITQTFSQTTHQRSAFAKNWPMTIAL